MTMVSPKKGMKNLPPAQISLRQEGFLFMNLAAPSVLIQLCLFGFWLENSLVVGKQFGSEALAAMSLANLSGNLTGLSFIFGVLSALDTLAPQAVGAGRIHEIGLLCVRGALLCFFCYQHPWQYGGILKIFF
eukprot:m.143559 g.143559  ORF g.143559 m.143559 type:complete len:132 (-) comp30322_c0_seq2:1081-1476(-)